jgi:hypothetical protein
MKSASSAYILVYDGIQNSGTRILELTQFNAANFLVSTYQAYVVAYNWVGASSDGAALTIVINNQCSAQLSIVSGAGIGSIAAAVSYNVEVQAFDTTGAVMTTYDDIFFLHVEEHCIKSLNFYCYPQPIANKILIRKIMQKMDSTGDENYLTSYVVPLNGKVTASVFLMQIGGAYGEYFDNLFMDGTPVLTRVDSAINFDWGSGLITPEGADYVSVRWYMKIRAPLSEDYTFILEADDGIRFYFEGNLEIDRWDTCCTDQSFTKSLTANQFYDIQLDYKEEQGKANIALYWTSLSIPKQIIPAVYMYYPQLVDDSPY